MSDKTERLSLKELCNSLKELPQEMLINIDIDHVVYRLHYYPSGYVLDLSHLPEKPAGCLSCVSFGSQDYRPISQVVKFVENLATRHGDVVALSTGCPFMIPSPAPITVQLTGVSPYKLARDHVCAEINKPNDDFDFAKLVMSVQHKMQK